MNAIYIGVGYFLIVGVGLFVWRNFQKEIERVELRTAQRIAEAANNAVNKKQTAKPIDPEKKGNGRAYLPSRDIDKILRGDQDDLF